MNSKSIGQSFYLHYNWKFLLADAFPLKDALEKWRDAKGHYFYEPDYHEQDWQDVTLPHSFNDVDLFRARIEDAGSGQKRTFAFYRKYFTIPKEHKHHKVLLEFEGMRQTCYLYVNGTMAGYYEAGVAPFGFDITAYVHYDKENLIAIATDNTAARNIDLCIAETPNKPDVEPGSYLMSQDRQAPADREGIGFFWNCNDFNPSVGGITRPVKIHFKPQVYLTLPLYSNLQTKGCYIYGQNYTLENHTAEISVEAEIRNETASPVNAWLDIKLCKLDDTVIAQFSSPSQVIPPVGTIIPPLSITPADAYIWKEENGVGKYVPCEEADSPASARDGSSPAAFSSALSQTATDSADITLLHATSTTLPLRFWSIDDPYLYRVEITLHTDEGCMDSTSIETGFCQIGYDKDRGVLINGKPIWLRGYAQRAANEWAAIGIAPEWLKDMDARLIRESNANHVRFMHVAGSPADIRAFDRHGIVCTQPAGDKERENFGRQWNQRVELMRDVIIAFRNHPSIFFWEAGNNSINKDHMRQMRLLKEQLDPKRGRFMGCRTINTPDVLEESEYVGTMLNRHAARFLAEHGPVTETEYLREEAPRRIWDDFTPPDFDYDNKWLGKGGRKQIGADFWDLTSEDFALAAAKGYSEFFHDRIGGASHKDWYSACAALCWTDSAQHGRQAYSENARMSGRVDAVRNKKQSFDIFRVMQSKTPAVKIVGHWNYPPLTGDNYRYPLKKFNGNVWEKTGEYAYRNPKEKTMYVFGSYPIAKIELSVNGSLIGSCDKPDDTFVFAFPNVDITRHGTISAFGYDYDGNIVATDKLETVGEPDHLTLTLHTSPVGLLADGADVAYVDIQVSDKEGRICPLCDARITFALEGEGIFLGGYNSGRFEGYGKDDSVIHKNYVYAECGFNRVFVRSTGKSGQLCLTAQMSGLAPVTLTWVSQPVLLTDYALTALPVDYETYSENIPVNVQYIPSIPEADAQKYTPEDQLYCKILINGQEPDTRAVRSINKNGAIWGAVLCILDRLKNTIPDNFTYQYDSDTKRLTLTSDGHTIVAEAGLTHLLVDGKENLMDGEPYISDSHQFVMEVSAIASYVKGTRAYYDEKVNVFRIETI